MTDKADRDIEKTYPIDQFIDKLRRLADSLESGEPFTDMSRNGQGDEEPYHGAPPQDMGSKSIPYPLIPDWRFVVNRFYLIQYIFTERHIAGPYGQL